MSSFTTRTCACAAVVLGVAATTVCGAGSAVAAPSAADSTFITDNAQTNLAEMTIGTLALQKAQGAEAKDLATMTIADHKTAMAQLTTVAQALGVTLPTTPNAEQQQQAATLQATTPADFDLAYAQIQVAGHQKSIAGTNTELSTGADQSVLTYAQGYLPVAQRHLTMAQTAVTDLGGTPGEVPAGTGGLVATTSNATRGAEIGVGVVGGLLVVGAGVMVVRRRRVTAA